MTPGSRYGAMVGMAPARNSPPVPARTDRSASATAANTARACGSSCSPAAVSTTFRPSRSNSRASSSASSSRICWLNDGWVTPSRAAARVKLPASATATKYRSR